MSQWPLLNVLVAVPHNSPQGADTVINCLMQMNSIIEQFFLVEDGKDALQRASNQVVHLSP
jgi:hypothetical protein